MFAHLWNKVGDFKIPSGLVSRSLDEKTHATKTKLNFVFFSEKGTLNKEIFYINSYVHP